MTVREFLNSFVASYANIKVVHFPETDASMEVLYQGAVCNDDMPAAVGRRVVASVIPVEHELYISVYKEDEQ